MRIYFIFHLLTNSLQAVFDEAIRAVINPPARDTKKKKGGAKSGGRGGCLIL